jgi:peptidoglycan/LPS O-acetylase OafA/YrhL
MKTVGAALSANRGIGPGFDFLRIALSISILWLHSFLVAQGERHQFDHPFLNIIHDALVPMFFALSGFLITGSALRLRLQDFLLNRAMRIVPALSVDIVVSAIIIGPLFTQLPLHQYFAAYDFRAYFANIFGMIHYLLPGVFLTNPFPATVNGSLWTVPFEIGCYALISFLIASAALKFRRSALAICAVLTAFILGSYLAGFDPLVAAGVSAPGDKLHGVIDHFFSRQGVLLYIDFMLGCLAYLFRDRIPLHPGIFGAALALLFGASAILPGDAGLAICMVLSPAIVYVTVFLGVCRLPKVPFYSTGDYSYGIYLYGFPLQQAITALFPGVTSPWAHFAISLPVVTAVAWFSWHVIEKPILGLRKKFSFTARKGDAVETLPPAQPDSIAARPEPDTGKLPEAAGAPAV